MGKKKLTEKEALMCERFKQYREYKGWSVKKMTECTGISQSMISEIENKKKKPGGETMEALIRSSDINPRWLITGEGHMTLEDEIIEKELRMVFDFVRSNKDVRQFIKLLHEEQEENSRKQLAKEALRHVKEKKLMFKLLADYYTTEEED